MSDIHANKGKFYKALDVVEYSGLVWFFRNYPLYIVF